MERPIVTRAEASAAGLKRYFTGKACPKGHVSERLTRNSECLKCRYIATVKHRRANPNKYRDARRVYKANRRAAKRNCDANLTPFELSMLRARYGKKCAICSDKGNLTIDHIIPLKFGGKHEARNIQFLCQPCNSSKGARPMEEFARSRGLLL